MEKIEELNLGYLPGHIQNSFEITAEIEEEESEFGFHKLLYIEIIDRTTASKDHYGLRFNIDWAENKDRIKWLADVLSRSLAENIWNAKKNQCQKIQSAAYAFGGALGLNIQKLS